MVRKTKEEAQETRNAILDAAEVVFRIGNSTTFPEVFQHLPPIVNRNFPPGSSDLSWNPCLFP